MTPAPDPHHWPATVYIVDDDESVRRALSRLIRAAGLHPEVFANVEEFVALETLAEHACVVADVRMHGTGGLVLPELLAQRDARLPVIFVTAQDTDATRAEAKRVGAAGYFRKPVDDQALIDAIRWALRDASNHPCKSDEV